jgi:branched-chain amino acid transport system permease protein
MNLALFLEQTLNGFQQGMTLFLMASGLTLTFGIMGLINLAHGSLYMIGAYVGATVMMVSGSFVLGVAAGIAAAGLAGALLEVAVLRRLYARDHLDQVLATFGVILFTNELVKIVWGPQALFSAPPEWLSRPVDLLGTPYPAYRLAIIAVGLLVALFLRHLILNTRLGMRIRAGATDRETASALGINIHLLFTTVFAVGAMLAGLAGALVGPILAVQIGMGENILILTFVVIIIGGIGSVRGAFVGAILVGLVDTYGRAVLPSLLRDLLPPAAADSLGNSLSDIGIYLLMAVVLIIRPQGLFQVAGAR